MQRHGGQIDIQSEVGRGSTFRLLLPAVRVRNVPPDSGPVRGSSATEAAEALPRTTAAAPLAEVAH